MKLTVALTLDRDAQSKGQLIIKLFSDINQFINDKSYGSGIFEYLIICQIVNPPIGYEHIFKDFRPKFIENKLMTIRLTGEPLLVEKQFSYSIKISGNNFEKFINGSDSESMKVLSREILSSFFHLDALPKKVKDFDKEQFKADMEYYFKEQKLI